MTHEAAAGAAGEALDAYVVVDREDVLDAMGAFIAAYLASLPEARNLQPAQLQAALKQAFQARGRIGLGFYCLRRRCARRGTRSLRSCRPRSSRPSRRAAA